MKQGRPLLNVCFLGICIHKAWVHIWHRLRLSFQKNTIRLRRLSHLPGQLEGNLIIRQFINMNPRNMWVFTSIDKFLVWLSHLGQEELQNHQGPSFPRCPHHIMRVVFVLITSTQAPKILHKFLRAYSGLSIYLIFQKIWCTIFWFFDRV